MSMDAFRTLLIEKLLRGEVNHEAREALAEKNLLAIRAVTPEQVAELLRRTTRQQYRTSPHHRAPRITVHEFLPVAADGVGWYIKAYFLQGGAWFISVHKQER